MPYRKSFILFFLLVACLFPHGGFAQTGRIAVLPLEDLSRGGNGLNLAITSQVREGMAQRGFAMAGHEEVIAFMVRNRVRWLGYLGSQDVRRLHDELGVEYILLGSVNQRRDKRPFALALTLQLIRAGDAQIIWAKSAELCEADDVGLLGLTDRQDMEEMGDLLVDKALRTIPKDLQGYGRPLEMRDSIESVFLAPAILKPGEVVRCRIKVGALPANLFNTSVSIFVDERIIEARYHEAENIFVASWPAALKSESYPVSVSISRPGAEGQMVLVGSYLVDGQAPVVALNVKGQELNGMVVLQEKVAIMPFMENPEPISRWLMTVRGEDGVEIMSDDGEKALPDRFSWWGQARTGDMVEDGFYTIGLTVWDRAGNSASAEEAIRVIRQKPQMVLAMKEQGNSLAMNLAYDGEIPLVYWRLEIKNHEGELISESSGTEATGCLTLPLASVAGQNIRYRLYAQDMFGNRLLQDVEALVPVEEKKQEDDGHFLTEKEGGKVALREIWADDF